MHLIQADPEPFCDALKQILTNFSFLSDQDTPKLPFCSPLDKGLQAESMVKRRGCHC